MNSQNDYISGTLSANDELAECDGAQMVQRLNSLISCAPFVTVIYCIDWHPSSHISFAENINLNENGQPPVEQRMWARHCVQDTWGAEMPKDLKVTGCLCINVWFVQFLLFADHR